jgi:hypothetical protein
MLFGETIDYGRCAGCGKDTGKRFLIIANGYTDSKILIKKHSADTITSFCKDCGKEKLSQIIEVLDCPIWIGIPKLHNVRKKKNPLINFKPELIG